MIPRNQFRQSVYSVAWRASTISLCVTPGLESIPVILKCLPILAQAPVLYFSLILVDQPSGAEFLDVTGTKV